MEIVNYADIPIPQFVDIILKGDDEAMYYLLHERLNFWQDIFMMISRIFILYCSITTYDALIH